MSIDIETATKSKKWKIAFEIIWGIAVAVFFIYSWLIWSRYSGGISVDDYYASIAVIIIFSVGLVTARWRFYKELNVRMFAINFAVCIFLIALLLREVDVISRVSLAVTTLIYVFVNVFLFRRRRRPH